MASLMDIEGIGKSHAEKLKAAGAETTTALLQMGATKAGREKLAADTGISEKHILEWVNHSDLERIKGVGWEFSDLLEEAGVDSVPELAQRNAESLHAKLTEINDKKNLVNRLPSAAQIAEFIAEAKTLSRIVTH
jgi:predicted flap endonuclease-1-like 5' DNA nuclease